MTNTISAAEWEAMHADEVQTCKVCGEDLEWVDCWNGCDDGFFDGYDDDPLWYDPGDLVVCDVCQGHGGYLACPNTHCVSKL